VHSRDGGATYECKNIRAYSGVDENCASEKPIWALTDAREIAENTVGPMLALSQQACGR
jgi:hypothetical protein